MKKTVVFFLFAILNTLHADLIIHKDFNITKSQKASIDYDDTRYGEGFTVTIGQDRIKLEMPEDFEGMGHILNFLDEKDLIIINDYNFDGYNDIGIVYNIGYMGVNIFADYHFYDPRSQTYKRYLESVSNLKIDTERLLSTMKSGPNNFWSEYKIKDKKPYKEIEGERITGIFTSISKFNSQGKIVKSYYEPTHLSVTAKRAYLYNETNEDTKTNAYILRGAKVKILNHDKVFSMLNVEYKGEKKSYRQWMKIEDFYEEDEE